MGSTTKQTAVGERSTSLTAHSLLSTQRFVLSGEARVFGRPKSIGSRLTGLAPEVCKYSLQCASAPLVIHPQMTS